MKKFNELKLGTIAVNIFTILYLQKGYVNTISFMRKLAKFDAISYRNWCTLHFTTFVFKPVLCTLGSPFPFCVLQFSLRSKVFAYRSNSELLYIVATSPTHCI